MAEPAGAGNLDIRRLILIGGVAAVIVISLFTFLLRSCSVSAGRGSGYTVIYSNMALKDAANAIARLKELAIPYEIRDDGKAIAVPKDKADQARLGLAEKNLPAGGVVGWEIFDESKLGATDFDRRIQLIRAISGELSRTIRRIEAVEDARVQIVIPETRLFAETVAPVTASVMLRLRPGAALLDEKISGIIHLVASSVENLQPENVTVIDNTGNILSANVNLKIDEIREEIPTGAAMAEVRAAYVSPEAALPESPTAELSAEEKLMLLVQTKKEMERNLTAKAQEIVNRFYPPNTSIIKVMIELKNASNQAAGQTLNIAKLSAIILIDNRVELTTALKEATYKTVAAAIGYSRERGDQITLQRVPFHLANPPPEDIKEQVDQMLPIGIDAATEETTETTLAVTVEPESREKPNAWLMFGFWPYIIFVVVVLLVFLIRRLVKRKEPALSSAGLAPAPAQAPAPPQNNSVINKLREATEDNPEKIADMLKKWLSE